MELIQNRISDVLENRQADYNMPFFWLHGESNEALLSEIDKIYASGIRGLCVESRPHEGFGTDSWFEDIDLILNRCKELGMDFWLLDDKHFPTGYANGLLDQKYPHLRKRAIEERHTDVRGPVSGGAVILPKEAENLLAVVAYRRVESAEKQELQNQWIDLTDKVQDGIVFVDLPEGIYRVFTLYTTVCDDHHIDPTSPESVDVLIEAVYEPHYQHYGAEFGKTFRGFFSDEPFIMRKSLLALRGNIPERFTPYPWNQYIQKRLDEKLGCSCLPYLPAIWWPTEGLSPKIRTLYMDAVTELYYENFNKRLQDWCHAHGVSYIGHIVEDNNSHSNFMAGGHYFRSLDGMDMAGIDVVLCQIVPGLQDLQAVVPCSYDISDPNFFSFCLAKMASSHAHVQPEKKGQVMCEMFGAYGWAEGLKMMKWLVDHMIVRGVNHFVPHAFSPQTDDPDCPPHFYAGGTNPQYPGFRLLMEYADRQIHLTTAGNYVPGAAILYHAEAEWSGGQYNYFYHAARAMTEAQLEFDILSCDYLQKGVAENGKLRVGDALFTCLIVPMSEYLPRRALKKMEELAKQGVSILWLDRKTEKATDCAPFVTDFGTVVTTSKLTDAVASQFGRDLQTQTPFRALRYMHRTDGKNDLYMLCNEDVDNVYSGEITFSSDHGQMMEYDAYTGKLTRRTDRKITLAPYETRFILFGDWDLPASAQEAPLTEQSELHTTWEVTVENDAFQTENLPNLAKKYPRFGGTAVYRAKVGTLNSRVLDLGQVGETAEVLLNGASLGTRIAPPYRFELPATTFAENQLEIRVTTNLGFARRDYFSSFLLLEPTGLLGPVTVKK